jgi:hypothetical protein
MKILFIEDTRTNIHAIERIAEVYNHELQVAMTGAEGLRLAHERPDLIFIDISLPDVDGLTVTRQMRQFLPATPIIAVTAHALSDDRDKCLAAGCTDYLAKPYKVAMLLELIDRYQIEMDSRNGRTD